MIEMTRKTASSDLAYPMRIQILEKWFRWLICGSFLFAGDVYRRDAVDACHYPCFHQMDGVRVYSWQDLGVASHEEAIPIVLEDLKTTLSGMVASISTGSYRTNYNARDSAKPVKGNFVAGMSSIDNN